MSISENDFDLSLLDLPPPILITDPQFRFLDVKQKRQKKLELARDRRLLIKNKILKYIQEMKDLEKDQNKVSKYLKRKDFDAAMRILDEEVVDIDFEDAYGQTPLIEASRFNSTRHMEEMFILGADPDLMNNYGETALMAAVKASAVAAVQMLLVDKFGQDRCSVHMKNNFGKKASDYVDFKHPEANTLLEILKEAEGRQEDENEWEEEEEEEEEEEGEYSDEDEQEYQKGDSYEEDSGGDDSGDEKEIPEEKHQEILTKKNEIEEEDAGVKNEREQSLKEKGAQETKAEERKEGKKPKKKKLGFLGKSWRAVKLHPLVAWKQRARAALVVQQLLRKKIARRRVEERKKELLEIERKKELKRRKQNTYVLRIQRVARFLLARKAFQRRMKRKKGAILIQRVYRGHRSRYVTKHMEEFRQMERRLHWATVFCQSCRRRIVATRRVRIHRIRWNACIPIQRYRRWLVKRRKAQELSWLMASELWASEIEQTTKEFTQLM
eukprot:g531.t1